MKKPPKIWIFQRKVFIFFFILLLNSWILIFTDKWSEGFGYFTVFLYSVIVIGMESTKVIKRKFKGAENAE